MIDQRAEIYIKKENLDQAYQDAQDMMTLAPNSVRGYFRAAQVYIQQERYEDAINIYKQCEQKVCETGDDDAIQTKLNSMEFFFESKIRKHVCQCQLTKASQVAHNWIRLYPNSYLAHTYAADIFSMRGQSWMAMIKYKDALKYVNTTIVVSNEEAAKIQNRLQNKIREVQECSQKRLDPITIFPFDVMAQIFKYVPISHLVYLLFISHAWNKHINENHGAWQKIHIGQSHISYSKINANAILSKASTHAQYIKEIELGTKNMAMGNTRKWIDLMSSVSLPSLVNLVLVCDLSCMDLLIDCLGPLQKTLTTFSITLNDYISRNDRRSVQHQRYSNATVFKVIWNTCISNLTSFECILNGRSFEQQEVGPLVEAKRLIKLGLSLKSVGKQTGYVDASPNLECLSLIPFPGILLESNTLQQLSHLKHINTDCLCEKTTCTVTSNYHPSIDNRIVNISNNIGHNAAGIQSMFINNEYNNYISAKQIYSFINRNKGTLEELTIFDSNDMDEYEEEFPQQEPWNIFKNFSSNTLQKFVCNQNGLEYNVIPTIFEQCPALEEVELADLMLLDDTIFEPLGRLPRLKSFEITSCREVTSKGFKIFFDAMISPGEEGKEDEYEEEEYEEEEYEEDEYEEEEYNEDEELEDDEDDEEDKTRSTRIPTLNKLTIENMKNVLTDESLLAMAQVKSLKEIHLDRAFVGIGLNEVVQNMNNLERLTLSKTRNNSKKQMDSVLDKLGNLPRLQKVTLIDCPAVTDDGIMSMLYKTTSLIHLKVRLCHAVSAKTLQDIKKIVVVG